jgi:hypothetical protein
MARNADGRATAYAYELPLRVVTRPTNGQAMAYAYERPSNMPRRATPNAGIYAYERAIPADPNQLFVWDEALESYVRVPWFVYNVDTGQWQQVL